jgi:hypothetical protein
MKLLAVLGSGILLALGLVGSAALAAPKETCDNATLSAGDHGSVTVAGTCTLGGAVTIHGNLTLAKGSVFAGFGPAVHVTGNVKVGRGALFALGYNTAPGSLGPDVVDGNVVANHPLSLYLGNVTVHGNVVSNGGGTTDRFYNFPIKDNKIDGNLIIHGWTGGWWGVVANTVGGNVVLSHNRSLVHPTDDAACGSSGTFPAGCDATAGADPDSSEVQSRGNGDGTTIVNLQHISGNLICHANTPSAQVSTGSPDNGAPNAVDGKAIGECAGLGGSSAAPNAHANEHANGHANPGKGHKP